MLGKVFHQELMNSGSDINGSAGPQWQKLHTSSSGETGSMAQPVYCLVNINHAAAPSIIVKAIITPLGTGL